MDLRKFPDIRIVAIGKAAHPMVDGFLALLPSSIAELIAASLPLPPRPGILSRCSNIFLAAIRFPTEASWKAAEAILALLHHSSEHTLVIFLLSGGGSALAELPLDPRQNLADVQQAYRALVTCGASIGEIGVVRRHFSAVKGGRLAVASAPAAKLTLAVTDVPTGQEAALASGPTLPDLTTLADAECVLEKYSLREQLPENLRRWMDEGKIPETPKDSDPAFANSHFELLLGMEDLFHATHPRCEAKGFVACCDNSTDDWPVEKAADYLLAQLAEWQRANSGQPVAVNRDCRRAEVRFYP